MGGVSGRGGWDSVVRAALQHSLQQASKQAAGTRQLHLSCADPSWHCICRDARNSQSAVDFKGRTLSRHRQLVLQQRTWKIRKGVARVGIRPGMASHVLRYSSAVRARMPPLFTYGSAAHQSDAQRNAVAQPAMPRKWMGCVAQVVVVCAMCGDVLPLVQ